MVSAIEEVRLLRRLLAEAGAELRERKILHANNIEVGIMVETPAAAMSLDHLGREADFFSVGSNDLLQYFLAADRGNARMGDLYDPLHPAFLRLLFQAAGQARKAKRWLGICGEMAGTPEYLPLLVGLGFDELSMAAPAIPLIKERVAELDGEACRALLRRVLRCAEAAEVAGLLKEFNGRGREAAAGVSGAELVRLGSASRTADEAIRELCDLLELDGRVQRSFRAGGGRLETRRNVRHRPGPGLRPAPWQVRRGAHRFRRFPAPTTADPLGKKNSASVRAVLMIAIPAAARGDEHLRLIARLSRRLMHEDFRETLLAAKDAKTVLAAIRTCLAAK